MYIHENWFFKIRNIFICTLNGSLIVTYYRLLINQFFVAIAECLFFAANFKTGMPVIHPFTI